MVEERSAAPAPPLAGLVSGYAGSRYRGLAPGTHRGLPTHHLGLVVSLGPPIRLAGMPDRTQPPGAFPALVHGLQTGPALIAHEGSSYTVTVDLTPAGARTLLGVPAAALASAVVSLDTLLGRRAPELAERMAAAPDWRTRFAVLDEVLTHLAGQSGRSGQSGGADPATAHAWRRIVDTGGTVRVGELAAETGASRQHLTKRFTRELGLTPKQAARVVRFARSRWLLQRLERGRRHHRPYAGADTLAAVAARCGFSDQAHLAREWRDLAGCPPSAWLATEELPFVQDPATGPVAAFTA